MLRGIARRLTYANVVASMALFVALGGISYAAIQLPRNSVGASQIKKNAVRSSEVRNSSLRGSDIRNSSLTGSDIKNSSLRGRDIRNSSLTGSDIRNGSLTDSDIRNGSLSAEDFSGSVRGPRGPAGPRGAQGPKGDAGAPAAAAWARIGFAGGVPSVLAGSGAITVVDGLVGSVDVVFPAPVTGDGCAFALTVDSIAHGFVRKSSTLGANTIRVEMADTGALAADVPFDIAAFC